jgi:hypothetical protein
LPLCSCRVFARSSQRASLTRLAELGPVLSGSDPGSFNGQSTVLTAVVNAALRPKSHTATSATYTLPARAFTPKVGNGRYVTTRASTLEYTFPATNPDQMVITGTFSIGGVDFPMVVTVSLANGSFTTSVKTHPRSSRLRRRPSLRPKRRAEQEASLNTPSSGTARLWASAAPRPTNVRPRSDTVADTALKHYIGRRRCEVLPLLELTVPAHYCPATSRIESVDWR